MKNLIFTYLLIILSIPVFAQSEKWKQKSARINFAVTPQVEFVKIGGSFSPAASISGAIIFNNTISIGGYFSKKIIRKYNMYETPIPANLDVSYQHMGLEFMYYMKMGLYRTKGGHYVHPKLKINFGTRLGGGTCWMVDENKDKISTREYFYYLQPQAGISYPLSDYISINSGICFTTALSVDKLSTYFNTMDFTGPGGYLGIKITFYR